MTRTKVANNMPVTYYYILNLQGDVIKLVDTSGVAVVNYTYDAWGNIVSIKDEDGNAITSMTHVGRVSPFRYRGYVYDEETGFYYCKSRYYDPKIRRFINADAIVCAGTGSLGLNSYAYCLNNPTSMEDKSGQWPQWLDDIVDETCRIITQVNAVFSIIPTIDKITKASAVALFTRQASFGDIWDDVKNYNFFNRDETKVLNAKVFSSYKGTPVIKHNIPNTTSWSISNTIFLNKGENEDNGGIETVKHEWGHTVQQSVLGSPRYEKHIFAPSVISCLINPSSKIYYSLPWERTADIFGGVKRSSGYLPGSDVISRLHLLW